ncbi:hypothetical protein [Ornithinimicrobium flavum]|uniref:hypothetical protein n=1 Tax=Ornithinimicrobium flavum TaxID=1288636 RepID=UPI0010702823|nr:hypothetical protein [Ornithinimicrobium flavum]
MKIHTTAVALLVSVAALTGCGDQEAPEVEAVDYSDDRDAAEREGLRREQAAAGGAGGTGGYARGWRPGHPAPSVGDDSTPQEVTRHRGLVMQ